MRTDATYATFAKLFLYQNAPTFPVRASLASWLDEMSPNMLRVARCESGLNPDAVGDGGNSYGVLQIHLPSHPDVTRAQALDPWFAVEWAYGHDPSLWTCARVLGLSKW